MVFPPQKVLWIDVSDPDGRFKLQNISALNTSYPLRMRLTFSCDIGPRKPPRFQITVAALMRGGRRERCRTPAVP
jgi:hypothetical protein